MELKLKKFDPTTIPDDRTVLVVGRRGSGKSTVARDILYAHRHIPYGVVFSGTEEANGAYGTIIPPLFLYTKYDDTILKRLLDRQKAACQNGGRPSPAFVVLDDCLFEKGVLKSPTMRELLLNGRHFKLFTVIIAQSLQDLPPAARGSFDFCVFAREPSRATQKRIWELWLASIPTYRACCQLLDQTTCDYSTLIVNNLSVSSNLSDSLFWYRSNISAAPAFKMGSRAYWAYSAAHYNTQHAVEQAAPPPSVLKVHRAGDQRVVVVKRIGDEQKKKKKRIATRTP